MSKGLALLFSLTTLLLIAGRAVYADAIDDETRRIGKQLQCPVCSGASVAESPSELAGQMRNVIRTKLEAGENESQIMGYFVDRYGDGVLIEPPRRGFTLVVWLAPLGALLGGAFLLWRLLRLWLRPRRRFALATDSAPTIPYQNGTAHADHSASPSSVDRARAELDRFRQGD
jgi:cytochrome c-type biogenesis protein CcmH